ncbi:MAG: hypothetical protein ABIS50_00075 [Luteolibacter sp.]|uniref:hypothetical protein n=1 Tax=Luteolibacter sp. TaxID=1962973 RepID=UPI003267B4B6
MALLLIVILVYIALGVGLIRLSMLFAKRIPFPALRIAIHTAVFTFWFMPGLAASEGGAMPGPMWLIILDAIQRGAITRQIDVAMILKMTGTCWGIAWIVGFGLDCICRRWEKKQSAGGGRKRWP